MDLSPAVVNGLFALGGALIGSIAPVITAIAARRVEERKSQRELAAKLALESWRLRLENTGAAGPLEHQLVYTALISELAMEPSLTPEMVKARLDEVSKIVDVMAEHSRASQQRNDEARLKRREQRSV